LPGETFYDLRHGIADADVVMCLRLQRERMDDGLSVSVGEYRRLYQVNRSALRVAAQDVIVMHPGPINRGIEVDDPTADGHASAISDQVTNGIFVRMAALKWCYGGQNQAKAKKQEARA
jgi:aspartate carbamoyltransferase catalytic subunit